MAIVAFTSVSPAHAGEFVHAPLRNSRIDVEAMYVRIASTDLANQRELYLPLSAQMKEDLWTVQLEYFISDHPELDQAQRSVVYEALGLLAAGALESSSSEEFTERTLALQQRAAVVLPRTWVAAAFVKLGAPETAVMFLRSGGAQNEKEELPRRYVSWSCDCNTDPQQDFCGGLTGPEHCIGGKGVCTFTTGCGWWWTYGCDGYCSG